MPYVTHVKTAPGPYAKAVPIGWGKAYVVNGEIAYAGGRLTIEGWRGILRNLQP